MKNHNEEKKSVSPLKIISTIIKVICIIVLILLIAVLALQRFSNNSIAVGGFRVFNVATESMVPKYIVGDVLVVKEQDIDSLKVGDDVTYLGKEGSFANRVVTHQIISIDETNDGKIFHTKGIANDIEDPTIKGDQIYGKVIYKCILISQLTKLMNNMTAFYIVVFVPFAILISLQLKDTILGKSDDDEFEDEDDNDEDEYEEDEEEYDEEDDEDEE